MRGGRGFIDRDFKAEPFASRVPAYSGKVYPRDQWRDMIEEQEKRSCSPYDVLNPPSFPS